MNIYAKEKQSKDLVPCPYLKKKEFQQRYMIIQNLSMEELDSFLTKGWRHFGPFFFRPACSHCKLCLPLRMNTADFKFSKSQRKLFNKNLSLGIEIKLKKISFEQEYFDLYRKHSMRFPQNYDSIKNVREFITEFCFHFNTSYVVTFTLNNTLIGLDFIDLTDLQISSTYFIWDPAYSSMELGKYSILALIKFAESKNIPYVNLGYYVPFNKIMEYKIQFKPYELYDWNTRTWLSSDSFPLHQYIQEATKPENKGEDPLTLESIV